VFGRRTLILSAIGASLGFRQDDPVSARPREGDGLIKSGDANVTLLKPDDIPIGAGFTMAWAFDPVQKIARNGTRLNQILLMRFDPAGLAAETRDRSAAGVVAYTSICTHSGCDVDTWLDKELHLFCPCHESKFDPRDAARVVDGPAPRPLPALPLTIVDGALVVAKPFTTPVGYEKG
jgi:Rieske Fe-S protein